jgi:hypothetical protein
MIMNYLEISGRKLVASLGWLLVAAVCWVTIGTAQAQTPSLPPGVQDVLKLSQAGLGEDVILSQIRSAGATYNLSADQIIYLSKSGVSQNVIRSLIGSNAAAAPAAPAAPAMPTPPAPSAVPPPPSATIAPPPSAPGGPTFDSFHDQLSPYGSWVQEPGLGLCWRPTVAAVDPAWRPYGDAGHWIYTDAGWSWESDYPWGGTAFHYGRWTRDGVSWVWVPGYDYAPAWVTWRHAESDGFVGWAPLPPAAVFVPGIGLEFGGRVAADVDFGLTPDAFIFVGYDHFWDPELRGYFVPRLRVDFLFHHSIVLNGYRFDHGHFFIDGLGRDRIGRFTHHDVRIEIGHDRGFGFHDDHRGFRDDRGHDDHGRDGHDRDHRF